MNKIPRLTVFKVIDTLDHDFFYNCSIEEVISKLQEIKNSYDQDIVFTAECMYEGGMRIEYGSSRLETDEEYELRVERINRYERERAEKERQLYLQLKQKFEKD